MQPYQAFILGLVQGVTEFLPISSSGHLAIFEHLFGFEQSSLTFNIMLHMATLASVIIFFREEIRKLTKSDITYILIGTIPIVVIGVTLQSYIEQLFSSLAFIAMGFFITSIALFSTKFIAQQKQSLDSKKAFQIGLAQAIAIVPGISRSGLTVSTSLNLGLKKKTAFSYSFLLSIPAIMGAMGLEVIKNGIDPIINISSIIGVITAFASGIIALALLKKLLLNSKLHYFAIYCVCAGIFALYLSFT